MPDDGESVRVQIASWISPDLQAALVERARVEGRSVSNLVAYILTRELTEGAEG